MPETPPPVDVLSIALLDVLSQIPDRGLSARLRRVYVAAALATRRLSDMDLINYETPIADASPDLSLWEEMAPVIRDTVMDVNALLTAIREQFPGVTPGGIADTISQALEEVRSSGRPEDRGRQAEAALHALARQLAEQVTHLGERMRSPQVVSDRWNLLADLQAFRSKYRELISDLVFKTASAFVEVGRKDVVPGYKEEVAASVYLRAAVTDLGRLLASRATKVSEALPEDIQWYAQQLEKDLDSFGRTQAYRALRAQDKRQVVEFRAALGKISAQAVASKAALVELLGPFVTLVESLSKMNNREVLLAHDREVWAACGVRLEQAEQALEKRPAQAAKALNDAGALAQELYGREAHFDTFLRKVKKTPFAASDGAALGVELNLFRELLSELPMP